MKAGPTTSIARVHAFGQYVAARTSFRVSDLELTAALAAVKLHPEQATTKLSPVVTRPVNPKKPHARPGPMPVGPKCISSYATYGTCPKSCVFMREDSGVKRGCSVDGNVNQLRGVGPLDEAARVLAGHRHARDLFALAEAFTLTTAFPTGVPQDGYRGGRDLRLHVVGDVTTPRAAAWLAEGVLTLKRRGLGRAWTFTHAWSAIPRSAFGSISALASVETPSGMVAAMQRGYAPAIVVPEFPDVRAFSIEGAPSVRVIPCPAEVAAIEKRTGNRPTCVTCGLCLDDQRLHRLGLAIAFAAHGQHTRRAIASLGTVSKIDANMKRRLPIFLEEERAT